MRCDNVYLGGIPQVVQAEAWERESKCDEGSGRKLRKLPKLAVLVPKPHL